MHLLTSFILLVFNKEPQRNAGPDQDVLSQLTALRQQLKYEEKRVQQQIDHTSAVVSSLFSRAE